MSKINILSEQVFNRIAAGEVVERPFSVVKELVENAIDAGATDISVYVVRGGKELIRVVDNGSGISRDDLPSAFLPHATSKISKASDLENINTLGFRGEAVASIASVSNMTIVSREKGAKGYSLRSDGGKMGTLHEVDCEYGTEVTVENLFYNVPVRLGFLKNDKGEETEIVNFMSRYILGRSEISFTLYVENKVVLQSFGENEESALVNVYGASTLKNCFRIDGEKYGIKIRGYIGNQNFFKANRSYQTVFLNGRYIVNQTISTAITGAYSNYAMKRQYPFYVLHLTMSPEIVDVNVHPNKADVRFADNRTVYSSVYGILSSVLDGTASALNYVVPDGNSSAPSTVSDSAEFSVKEENKTFEPQDGSYKSSSLTYEQARKELEKLLPANDEAKRQKSDMELPFNLNEKEESAKIEQVKDEYIKEEPVNVSPVPKKPERMNKMRKLYSDLYFEKNEMVVNSSTPRTQSNFEGQDDYFLANKAFLEEQERINKQNRIEVDSCKYAGKLFNTYLLFERNDEVYIIDQHAAHERLIFNKLKEKMAKREVMRQSMLIPIFIQLNAFEKAFIAENAEIIRSIGFDLSEDENGYNVTAVPTDLQTIDVKSFFHEILAEINSLRAIRLEEILKDKLASMACKAAVKGGMDLTQSEIDELFTLMDGDMGLKCPHGRPVVVKMTRTELEKLFKRIV